MSFFNNKIINAIKDDAATFEFRYSKKNGVILTIPTSILVPIIVVGALSYNYGDQIDQYLSNASQSISQKFTDVFNH